MAKETIKDFEEEAALAVAEEEKAKAQPDEGVYVHKFKKPFTYNNQTVEELTFDWESLTGADYDTIEAALARDGVSLIVPEYVGGFLAHMAVHACTTRDNNGIRFVDRDFLRAMPMREYKALLGKARGFLLRWGSQPTK